MLVLLFKLVIFFHYISNYCLLDILTSFELMSLYDALEEKLKKKEERGERLVGAVVNGIVNNK